MPVPKKDPDDSSAFVWKYRDHSKASQPYNNNKVPAFL
jgi:hypothetical protein